MRIFTERKYETFKAEDVSALQQKTTTTYGVTKYVLHLVYSEN